jgi:hypothetical protein
MKKILSIILIGCLVFSITGCGANTTSGVEVLKDNVVAKNYLNMVEEISDNLYNTSGLNVKFSAVGSLSDKNRTDYIYDKFNEIGLSNVKKVPIMLNSWDYTGVTIVSNCNCSDNTNVTMRIVGSYPAQFEYKDTKYILHRIENESDITQENIENFAVLLPNINNKAELEKLANAVAVYNPTLMIYDSTHTAASNMYEVDTELFKNINCPIFVLPNGSYEKLNFYFNNSKKKDTPLELTLNGTSYISEDLVESHFVIGEIEGKNKDKVVYVTAHQDAIHNGYMGSCVSVAQLIAIADKMINDGYKPDYTIRFMITTGQEWGLKNQGKNTGIQTYLNNLSEKEINNIQSVLVLDGGYPLVDTVFLETRVSNTKIFDIVTSYNTDYFAENNNRFINEVLSLDENIKYVTEATVWNEKGIDTVLSAEPNNSRFGFNNTSLDTYALDIDELLLGHNINYYSGLIKIMSNN